MLTIEILGGKTRKNGGRKTGEEVRNSRVVEIFSVKPCRFHLLELVGVDSYLS